MSDFLSLEDGGYGVRKELIYNGYFSGESDKNLLKSPSV
jgi:hypothetical protein